MATLYELLNEYGALYQALEDCEEDEFSDTLRRLAEIEDEDLPRKIEQMTFIMRDAEAKSEMLKKESKRLRQRAERYESTIERLRSYVRFAMQTTGAVKMPTKIGTWTYGKLTPSVLIDMPDWVPEEYIRVREPEFDKGAIKRALKAGIEVPGAHLCEHEGVTFRG